MEENQNNPEFIDIRIKLGPGQSFGFIHTWPNEYAIKIPGEDGEVKVKNLGAEVGPANDEP